MFPTFANATQLPHPGTVTFVADGTERTEPAASLPDWLKFAPAADGHVVPVVRVVRCPAANGYTLRSFGPDGRLLWVTLMASPAADHYRRDDGSRPGPHTAGAGGWF